MSIESFNTGILTNNSTMIGYRGQAKVDPALVEAISHKSEIPTAKLEKNISDSFVSSLTQATSNNNGKFDLEQAAKNFGKGLIFPITGIFSSPKNFIMGTGMMAAAGALTIATGGAILPFWIGVGAATSAFQAVNTVRKIKDAKNGDEVEKAFFDTGVTISCTALTVVGAKPALNAFNGATNAGIQVSSNPLIATGQCIMNAKVSLGSSIHIAKTSGLSSLAQPLATLKAIGDASKGQSKAVDAYDVKLETQVKVNSQEPKPVIKANENLVPIQAHKQPATVNNTEISSSNKYHSKHIKLNRRNQQTQRVSKKDAERFIEASKKQAKAKAIADTQVKTQPELLTENDILTNLKKENVNTNMEEFNRPFLENYQNGFNPEQSFAIKEYGGTSFEELNRNLRGLPTKEIKPQELTDIKKLFYEPLDNAIQRVKTTEELIVYRGVKRLEDGSLPFNIKGNGTHIEHGYSSTSYLPEKVMRFSGINDGQYGAILKIKVPKGTPVLHMDEAMSALGYPNRRSEAEILLPKDIIYNFKSFDSKMGIVEAEISLL